MNEKFETCKHRSEDDKGQVVTTCCAQVLREGYFCFRKEIYNLNPYMCEKCDLYEKKESPDQR